MFPMGWSGQATGAPAIQQIQPRVFSEYSNAAPVPNCDLHDIYKLTALAGTATFGAPWGCPFDGQWLEITVLDNGGAQTLAWNAVYVASGSVALPTTTIVSTLMSVVFQYSLSTRQWVCKGIA